MRVLVLSVTAGQGHNTCAKAAMAALEARGAECQMLDTLGFLSSLVGAGVDKGYLLMGKLSPGAFGMLYESSLASSVKRKAPPVSDMLTDGMTRKLADYIDDFAPDCILCTHVFAALIITHLREKALCGTLTIGINTDFSIPPLWEQADQDYFVLPCSMMNYAAYLRGLPVDRILPFGLPVDAKFSQKATRQEARAALGLADKTTLTIMSGSMGFGHLAGHIRNIDTLPLDFQMVAICGNNKDAYDEITALIEAGCFEHTVRCEGFVHNVHQYMQAGDVLVTKPGGLSTTECLHVERPMVLMEPIPGLEQYNAAFLVNCGAAVYATDHYPLHEAVYNLLSSPERRQNMMHAQKAVHPGVAADLLADFIFGNPPAKC